MEIYRVQQSDLIGQLEGFPIEVVQKMVEYQYEQTGKCDVNAFQYNRESILNFDWTSSAEGYDFWCRVIHNKRFDLFFERYPKQEQEELPLPRMVLVWNKDESMARERELIYILPNNLDLDYRFVTRKINDQRDSETFKHMKELPQPKKMTKEEIEKELGYKIEIV